jgi:hypothetical protein
MSKPEHMQLAALLLGDLPREEAAALEAALARDPALRVELERLGRAIAALRELPGDDAGDALVDNLKQRALALVESPEAPVLRPAFAWLAAWPRVAAAAVIVAVFGLAIAYTPPGPAPQAGVAFLDSGRKVIAIGETFETRAGAAARVELPGAELLLEGGSALSVPQQGRVHLLRGRVISEVHRGAWTLEAGGRELTLAAGSIAILDYDSEFARVAGEGALVEVRRTPLAIAAGLAREAYGLELDTSRLPQAVLDQRVNFFGTGIGGEEYVRFLVQAAARYGVGLSEDGRALTYAHGTVGRVDDSQEPELLSIALLRGQGELSEEGRARALAQGEALIFAPSRPEGRPMDDLRLARALAWAGGRGNQAVDERLARHSEREGSLPGSTIILADRLVLRGEQERVFLLDGPEFNFPLPGGRLGRLVSVHISGAEFEVEGAVRRVFVPFSSLAERE